MSNLSAQSPSNPVDGAYFQPSPGVAIAGVEPYRDTTVTSQVFTTANAPTAGTVVATVTPGTAGLWEITGYVTVTGTTVAATDTNNMRLRQTSTAILSVIPMLITGTTGSAVFWPIPTVVANLSAADTVNVIAIANATASSVYQACLVCRLIG